MMHLKLVIIRYTKWFIACLKDSFYHKFRNPPQTVRTHLPITLDGKHVSTENPKPHLIILIV